MSKELVKEEIDRIKSLMGRMNMAANGESIFMMEARDMSQRVRFNTIIELLEKNMQSGKFISMGYFNQVDLKKRVYPVQRNIDKANQVLGMSDDDINSTNSIDPSNPGPFDDMGDWRSNITRLTGSKEWDDTANGRILTKKKPKRFFDTPKDILDSVISFTTYVWKWQSPEDLSRSFRDLGDREMRIRKKYGFGRDDHEYTDEDWQSNPKYGGTSLLKQIEKKNNNKGTTYIDNTYAAYNIFGDTNPDGTPRYDEHGHQKQALRQNMLVAKKQSTKYYIVDADGNVKRIPYQVKNFLQNYIGDDNAGKVVEYMDAQEKEFEREMSDFAASKKGAIKQYNLEKMAFMVATVKDPKTGDRIKAYWVNDDPQGTPANQECLRKITNHELGLSEDALDMAEMEIE